MKVEWHVGDLADLAFLRADSIDVAFSAYAVAEVDDPARLFRQVQRVLKPNAAFVFSYEHPMALCLDDSGTVTRSYFDPGPVDVERDDEPVRIHVRDIGDVFSRARPSRLPRRHRRRAQPATPGARSRRPSSGAPARKACRRTGAQLTPCSRAQASRCGVGLVLGDPALVEATSRRKSRASPTTRPGFTPRSSIT